MNKTSFVYLVALGILVPRAAAEELIVSFLDDKNYEYRVQESDFKSAPLWKEDAENPPLSARRAIKAAKREVARVFGDAHEWKVERLCLEPNGSAPGTGAWYWVVIFAPSVDSPNQGHEVLRIPVMMDGTIPTPRIFNLLKLVEGE